MAARAQGLKVLRIGLIRDGKIVQEKLIGAGESVTVGESTANTFVFPETSLSSQRFTLFEARRDGYTLQFTSHMNGRVSANGAVVPLERLRDDGRAERKGPKWRFKLNERDRGKIDIDGMAVLFQFVPAPPVRAVRPIQSMNFRPVLLEEDDPALLGFLAFFTALAGVLLIWVLNAEPAQINSFEEIPDRFTKLVIQKEETEPEKVEEIERVDDQQTSKEEKVEEAPKEAKPEPKNEVEKAKQREERKAEVMEKSLLLKMIVTRGQSSGGTAATLWSDEDAGLGDLDAALRGTTGVEVASASDQALRQGQGGSTEDADIGGLGKVGGGDGKLTNAPEVKVQGSVEMGVAELDEEIEDQSAVKDVVKRNFGQLTYCYESRLKQNPSLSGRVAVEWNVARGRVTSASIFTNTTGDSAFAQCIMGKIKRWRFPSNIEGEINYPFLFRPKG